MTTLSQAPARGQGESRRPQSRTLHILGVAYDATPISPGEDGTSAYRLVKRPGGACYAVIRTHLGLVECDCPDYEARRRGITAEPCKHGNALVEAGLVEAPRPVTSSQDRPEAPGLRPRDEFDPPGSPALMPVTPPARQPDVREVGGMTIDLDIWRNGPREATPEPASSPEPAQAQAVEPCTECGEVHENEGDASTWDEWTDEVGAQVVDATMPLVAWLRLQVTFYQALGTKAADLVAEHLTTLVTEAEITQARTPTQLRDRRAALAV